MGPVETAVKADLDLMGDFGKSGLAEAALTLARQLDHGDEGGRCPNCGSSVKPFVPASSLSMCAQQLLNIWNRLIELAPRETRDGVDELEAKRAERQRVAAARIADPKDQPST